MLRLPLALMLPLLLGLAPRWGLKWKGRKLELKLNGEEAEAEADGEGEEAGDVVEEVGRRFFVEVDGW